MRPLDWREFIDDPKNELTADDIAKLDSYFTNFVHPDGKCPGCGKPYTKNIFESFVGSPDRCHVEWGLAHGEAFCSTSKWPYRGHHFNVGPIKQISNWFLAYHPDVVSQPTPEKGG